MGVTGADCRKRTSRNSRVLAGAQRASASARLHRRPGPRIGTTRTVPASDRQDSLREDFDRGGLKALGESLPAGEIPAERA